MRTLRSLLRLPRAETGAQERGAAAGSGGRGRRRDVHDHGVRTRGILAYVRTHAAARTHAR